MVGVVAREEALRHLPAGAQPGRGGRAAAAQRSLVPALPVGRPRLGVRCSGLQAGALPVQRQHVRVHLPDQPDERRPLPGGDTALPGAPAAHQARAAGCAAGHVDTGVRDVAAPWPSTAGG